jgi:bla regulator protein blaR1
MTIPAFWSESWTAALVNHLWQSTVVVGIVWLLAVAFKKNQARVRYWVWMVASVKFLVPLSLLIAAGEWLRSLMATPVVVQPALARTMEQVAQPFSQAQAFTSTEMPAEAHHASWLPTLLLAVWACGALVVALRFGHAWWKVYAAKRAARPIDLATDVPVLYSPALVEPGILGIFRPVLLLPEGILERLTAAQFRAIVAHEMCHVRRRDNLTFAIHMLVEVLFWFYPAVWWIGARLIDERERACDEAVLQAGSEAEVYAEGILNVCKFYVESPLKCVAGISGSNLKKRIVDIMAERVARKLDFARKLWLSVAAGRARLNQRCAKPGSVPGKKHSPGYFGDLAGNPPHRQRPSDCAEDLEGGWRRLESSFVQHRPGRAADSRHFDHSRGIGRQILDQSDGR